MEVSKMPALEEIPQRRNPYMTTDTIIEYNSGEKEGIILIYRKNPPHGLALPGGFAEWGISLEENAIKEAKEETNLEVILEDPEHPLVVKSRPNRDPRTHTMSAVYIAKGYGNLRAGDDAARAYLFSIPEVKEIVRTGQLVFDHEDIVREYLQHRGHM